MSRRVALLRAINVGGRNKLPMSAVKRAFADAGATEVTTYVQSGNVVFDHASRSEAKLVAALEAALAAVAGFAVPVILRSAAEWAAMIDGCPYTGDAKTLQVMLLPAPPARGALDGLDAASFAPEAFSVQGRDIYLHLPNGMGRSKLAVALGRHRAARAGTARNWRTVGKLSELLVARDG